MHRPPTYRSQGASRSWRSALRWRTPSWEPAGRWRTSAHGFTPAMDGTAMGPAFLLASAPREPAAPNALLSTAERQIETIRAFLDQ
jgi:hypothetical protein